MKKTFCTISLLLLLGGCATQADVKRFELAREQIESNKEVKIKIIEGHYQEKVATQYRKAIQAQSVALSAPKGKSKRKDAFSLYEMACEALCGTCNTVCMEKCPEPDEYPPKAADELMNFGPQSQAGMVSINIGDGNIGIVNGSTGNDINTGNSFNHQDMPAEFSDFINRKVAIPETDYEKTLKAGERVFDKLIYPVATVIGIGKITDGFEAGMRNAGGNKTTNEGDIGSDRHEESPGSRNVLEMEVPGE